VGPQGVVGPQGPLGPQGVGPQGQAGSTLDPIVFGNATDDVVISTSQTLPGDLYGHDITVTTGVTLNTGGYRIFASGTLTVQAGAVIANNGQNASGFTAGPGALGGTLGAGASGGSGSTGQNGFPAIASFGGAGGAGAASAFRPGNSGGPANRPSVQEGYTGSDSPTPIDWQSALRGRTLLTSTRFTGGAGGGSGGIGSTSANVSGGGGGGGGPIVIAAKAIAGTGTVRTMGGAGSVQPAGSDGAPGGGGGGGFVFIFTSTPPPLSIVLDVSGGPGGPGAVAGNPGVTAIYQV
jgi:hypothetical protein